MSKLAHINGTLGGCACCEDDTGVQKLPTMSENSRTWLGHAPPHDSIASPFDSCPAAFAFDYVNQDGTKLAGQSAEVRPCMADEAFSAWLRLSRAPPAVHALWHERRWTKALQASSVRVDDTTRQRDRGQAGADRTGDRGTDCPVRASDDVKDCGSTDRKHSTTDRKHSTTRDHRAQQSISATMTKELPAPLWGMARDPGPLRLDVLSMSSGLGAAFLGGVGLSRDALSGSGEEAIVRGARTTSLGGASLDLAASALGEGESCALDTWLPLAPSGCISDDAYLQDFPAQMDGAIRIRVVMQCPLTSVVRESPTSGNLQTGASARTKNSCAPDFSRFPPGLTPIDRVAERQFDMVMELLE